MGSGIESTEKLYDRLAGLYQRDPEEFDRITREMIRKALDSLPDEQRARGYGLQMRIEHRLRRFKDPVARMNEMVVIFWENFYKFQEIINNPAAAERNREKKGAAKIIPFSREPTRH